MGLRERHKDMPDSMFTHQIGELLQERIGAGTSNVHLDTEQDQGPMSQDRNKIFV
jgi:hypothetical protein